MSFESTAREILESLQRSVKEQNKVFHQSDFVRCEAVRAGTSFGGSADQQEPFVDWLLALQGRGMVQVKRLDEACMVALGPEGRVFLLTQPKDETQARSRREAVQTPPGVSPGAFVCHGSQDREFVEKLSADLRSHGVDVWFSEWEIRPGDSIRQKIDDGLQRCEFFIIVLSKTSIGRPWVHTELDAATIRRLQGRVRKIIPIKIDDCGDLPATLNSLRWEDFASGSYDSSLDRVLDSIFERDVRPPLGKPPVGRISVERAIHLLEGQIAEAIENVRHDDPKTYEWEHITHRIVAEAFGEHHQNANHFITTVSYAGLTDEENQEQHFRWVRDKKNMLRTFVRELQIFHQPTPSPPSTAASDPKPSRLQFSDTMFASIGSMAGHEAFLIALSNVEKRYQYKCHGITATLSFTHEHSGETLKKTGWFGSIDERTGRVCDFPSDSITLDSKTQSRTWLIVYVNRNVQPMGQFWYSGPSPDSSPLAADYLLSHEFHRLLFGAWKVKIVITSDGNDRAEVMLPLEAE